MQIWLARSVKSLRVERGTCSCCWNTLREKSYDFCRKSWVTLLKQKSNVEARLKEWKALVEPKSGDKLLNFKTINTGEFKLNRLLQWLKLMRVKQEFTPPRSPQNNGVAERMNKTLQNEARSMMQHLGLGGGS